MKVGGGLNYVVGPMGSGKSFFAVRKLVASMAAGQHVVTNVELLPGWEELAAHHFARFSPRARARAAWKFRELYHYEADLFEAMRYRLPGRGEARGVFAWDETHNDLNNRSWRQDGRGDILEWATQLRKLGYVGFLLSQHTDNTDAQLRRVCNHVIRLQNQREQMRVLGVRITPWPLFLALWIPAHAPVSTQKRGSSSAVVRTERYFLDWHRNLYDTHGLYHGLDQADGDAAGLILLPELRRGAPAREPARAPVEGQAAA